MGRTFGQRMRPMKVDGARSPSSEVQVYHLDCDQEKCRWKAGPFKSEGAAKVMWKEHMKTHGIDVK